MDDLSSEFDFDDINDETVDNTNDMSIIDISEISETTDNFYSLEFDINANSETDVDLDEPCTINGISGISGVIDESCCSLFTSIVNLKVSPSLT